jgi:uncharacterized protein YegL
MYKQGDKLRRANIYYMIDTSEAMMGYRIGTINAAIEEATLLYKEIEVQTGANVFLKLLGYGTWAKWYVNEYTPLDDYIHNDLSAGGKAEFGAALNLLGTDMKDQADSDGLSVIILIAYENPTDSYEQVLKKLYELYEFRDSLRIVINIENHFPYAIACEFAGIESHVVSSKDTAGLKDFIIHGLEHYYK